MIPTVTTVTTVTAVPAVPVVTATVGTAVPVEDPAARGLHSFTSQLNLSVFYEIGNARRGCVARIKGM
jgi:hypothetical protein